MPTSFEVETPPKAKSQTNEEKSQTKPTSQTWRDISPRLWLSLGIGILTQLASGSNYAFSAWSDSLKTVRNYSQPEIELVGSLGNTGQYAAILTGIVNDILGIKVSCLVSCSILFTGNFFMYTTTRGLTPALNAAGVQGFFYMLASLGSSSLMTGGVSSNVNALPSRYRGQIVALLFGIYALSASIFTAIYNGVFNATDLQGFQLFMTIMTVSVAICAAFLLAPLSNLEKNPNEIENNEPLLKQPPPSGELDAVGATSAAGNFRTSARHTFLEVRIPKGLVRVVDVFVEKVTSLTFCLLFFTFIIGVGAGVMHINNIGQLTKALNGDNTAANAVFICVTIQSVFNGIGRISMGITDHIRIRRGYFYTLGLSAMAIAQLLAAVVFIEGSQNFVRVYGITVLTGLSYGIFVASCSIILAETFRAEDFGQNWGWMLLAALIGSYVFNGVAGALYNQKEHEQKLALLEIGEEFFGDCSGSDCFRNAYFFGAGMCLFGALISLFIIPRTQFGKKDTSKLDSKDIESFEARRRASSVAVAV